MITSWLVVYACAMETRAFSMDLPGLPEQQIETQFGASSNRKSYQEHRSV
jgi:hypothetical protein